MRITDPYVFEIKTFLILFAIGDVFNITYIIFYIILINDYQNLKKKSFFVKCRISKKYFFQIFYKIKFLSQKMCLTKFTLVQIIVNPLNLNKNWFVHEQIYLKAIKGGRCTRVCHRNSLGKSKSKIIKSIFFNNFVELFSSQILRMTKFTLVQNKIIPSHFK